MRRTGLASLLVASVTGQDLFLPMRPTRPQCDPASGARTAPSADVFQELCHLLYKNGQAYTISWTPPHAPPALFQDHIAYDLVTMWKLGATAEQLSAAYDVHVKQEKLLPLNASTGRITEANWKANIGKNPMVPDVDYPDYLDFYRQQLHEKGLDATIQTYLPALVGGTFDKLFHGQQMLGWSYGETGDEEMAAQGLAWMSTAFSPPAPLAAHGSRTDIYETFEALHKESRLPRFKGDATTMYYVFLADLVANFTDVLAEYDLDVPDDVSVEDSQALAKHMQDASFRLFAAHNYSSFTHIHFISSSRAISNLMDLLPASSRAELLRRQWQSMVYNFAVQSRPSPVVPALPSKIPSWDDIVARTFAQTEWHLHEIVFYAKENFCGADNRLVQVVADRALALIEGGGKWTF